MKRIYRTSLNTFLIVCLRVTSAGKTFSEELTLTLNYILNE